MVVFAIVVCYYQTISHGCVFFFFSSRRRHTRFDCDWSSDVCSSDLMMFKGSENVGPGEHFMLIFNNGGRSEEHTSELQSQSNLVCRLLLEKKKTKSRIIHPRYASHHSTSSAPPAASASLGTSPQLSH